MINVLVDHIQNELPFMDAAEEMDEVVSEIRGEWKRFNGKMEILFSEYFEIWDEYYRAKGL